jgi:hypothetical protein
MKRKLFGVPILILAGAAVLSAAEDRWIHVKVEETSPQAEIVRINLPLSLAEKLLPAIHTNELHEGRVKVKEAKFNEVDIRAILDALRTAQDNEFVTVESDHENVRVAKAGGRLLIKVHENKNKSGTVDVSVPFSVVDALLSGEKDELNVLAAVRALSQAGDVELVTVNDKSSKVRIWVDSRNTAD